MAECNHQGERIRLEMGGVQILQWCARCGAIRVRDAFLGDFGEWRLPVAKKPVIPLMKTAWRVLDQEDMEVTDG